MGNKKIKVFIADDHEIFRDGVKQLINNEIDMEVVGTAANGEEALELIIKNPPDVIIMDIRMPDLNGIETSKELLKASSALKIIFFSLYDREDYVSTALEMGAHGYILKDTSNKIFLMGIRAVFKGEYYFTGEVSDIIVRKYIEIKNQKIPAENIAVSIHATLSKREMQILIMVRNGQSNKDIAETFGLSIRTVETHRLNMIRRFNVNSIEEVLKLTE